MWYVWEKIWKFFWRSFLSSNIIGLHAGWQSEFWNIFLTRTICAQVQKCQQYFLIWVSQKVEIVCELRDQLCKPCLLSCLFFFCYFNSLLSSSLLSNNKVIKRSLCATKYPCTRQHLHRVCHGRLNLVLVITIEEDDADVLTLQTESSMECPERKWK